MRIMWTMGITPTLKVWNPRHFVYEKEISLNFETMRNWRSTAQLSQPTQSLTKKQLVKRDSNCLKSILGSIWTILPSREYFGSL